jgi:hypothetical protein
LVYVTNEMKFNIYSKNIYVQIVHCAES